MKLATKLHWLALSVLVLAPTLSDAGGPASPAVLAQTPPMGWSSWNFFNSRVTEGDIRNAADAVVSSGMRDAGYTYINIDDSWQGERDVRGYLHPNSRFSDMKALVGYVHGKGLKIGIYSSPGPSTCGDFPGSYGHEEQDAQSFVGWGFDNLKYDLCSFQGVVEKQAPGDSTRQRQAVIEAYGKMASALDGATRAAGRSPMLFSICEYGLHDVWQWGPRVGGTSWRTTYDVYPIWDRMTMIAEAQNGLEGYAGPGHWNDPDMLVVGNGRFTLEEDKTNLSWWAILAAPLIAGNDLTAMTADIRTVLTNKDVIEIDQDPLGRQGRLAYSQGFREVWIRELQGGALAVAVINTAGPADVWALSITVVSCVGLAAMLFAGRNTRVMQASAVLIALFLVILWRSEGVHKRLLPLYVAWTLALVVYAICSRLPRRIAVPAAVIGILLVVSAGTAVLLTRESGVPTTVKRIKPLSLRLYAESILPFHLELGKLGLSGPQPATEIWTHRKVVLVDDQVLALRPHGTLLFHIDHPVRAGLASPSDGNAP